MVGKPQAMCTCFLLVCALWTSTSSMARAQSEELQRPTRPDTFTSADQVAQYVKDMHEYLRRKSIRYGKRFAPMPNVGALQTAEMINDLNTLMRRDADAGDDAPDEANPQEQLARRPMDGRWYHLLAEPPLPFLAKYLRVNQMIKQHQSEPGNEIDSYRHALLHPFVRQSFIAAKQKVNDS